MTQRSVVRDRLRFGIHDSWPRNSVADLKLTDDCELSRAIAESMSMCA